MTLALSLFGVPTVTYGGTTSTLAFERRGQLLAFLALKRTWVGRAELAALLWPEQESKLAYTNLRKALFRLQSLAWGERVEAHGGALRLDVATDVSAFESALRERRLADAVALRRGDLLAGFDDPGNDAWSSWLGFERDRLRVAWRAAAQEYLAGDIDAGTGVDLAAQLLGDDPLDEAALRIYMTWLVRTGQGGRARQSYRDFVTRLHDELGLDPSADLRALHNSLGLAPLPPAGSLPPPPKDAGFVGRAVEMRRIATLLAQDDCRLLCITGPGGVGKTRLARRVILESAVHFPDGAVFVPLEDVPSTSELGRRLARELGVVVSGKADPLHHVTEFLRERRMLLVLDNFEHLAAEAAVLDKLLTACPGLKMIVTSRERLAVAGEWLLPLEGLPCPEVEDQDRLEAFDAVRLFTHAARRVAPGLVPAVEAPAIIDICRQVEGLPLALELAASWTRVLSCDAIAAELRQGTELLHVVDASRPARHASMEVVFEQSWRLLSAAEREAFPRLSVFRGGFSAEAARAVVGASLPVLGALADKSLLRKEHSRLHLHPLVQQLAAARHGDGPDSDATQAAHAAYFHRLLAQQSSGIAAGDRAAVQSIDEEFENCRRAWTWSIAHAQNELIARSATPLLDYCDHRGRLEECLALFRQAIASPRVHADPQLEALLISKLSHVEYRLDRYADAQAHAEQALAATRRNRDRATRSQAVNVLATCALRQGRLEDARRYFKQALAETSPEHEAHSLAVALDHLALIEKAMGNYAEALRLSLESLAKHRSLGDVAGEALCLSNLGSLHIARRDYAAAGVYLREGLAICERSGIVGTLGFILANLTEVSLRIGDLAAAAVFADRGLEVASGIGNRAVVAWMKINIASIAAQRGELATARATLADGLGLVTALGVSSLRFDAIVCFAEILEAQGANACARQVMTFASGHQAASEAIRGDIRARLDTWPGTATAPPAWTGMELDELIHRIVAESSVAYAPLIATLGGMR